MLTIIYLERGELITKEAMEIFCKGEHSSRIKDSVNDDLESLFQDLRLGKEPQMLPNEFNQIYFLPKLTEKELELVEREDPMHLHLFYEKHLRWNPYLDQAAMRFIAARRVRRVKTGLFSESDSKFLKILGYRRTFTIERQSESLTEVLSSAVRSIMQNFQLL